MRVPARSAPFWLPLAGIVALSAILRFWGALGIPAPWIAADEMVYAELGRSLVQSGKFEILGHPTGFYSLVYPLLAGLPLSLSDVGLGYGLLKALQAVVMSLAAVPAYFWGRELMSHRWALLAAALTVAIPGLAYSGLVMTEVAFYPVAVLAAWALARALVRPTPRNQAFLVGAIVLAAATRLQALVLLPVVVTAVGLYALLARRFQPARALWPALAVLGGLAALWGLVQLTVGGSVIGAYEAAGTSSYTVGGALRYVGYHVADAILFTGIVPACAVVLLAVEATRKELPAAVRAYLAVTLSLVAWFVLEVGVFASRHVGQLAERDLLALAAPLFVGFALWLDRGAPRTRLAASVVALAVAAPVLLLPLNKLVKQAALPDSFTVAPLYLLKKHSGDNAVELAVFLGTAVAVLAFALLPKRLLPLLAVGLLVTLAAGSAVATRVVADQAGEQRLKILGANEQWIDHAASGPVTYVYDGDPYWNAVWEQLFWNRRLRAVYRFPWAKRVPGPLRQPVVRPLPDGRLLLDGGGLASPGYVVASPAFTFVGDPVARTTQVGQEGLQLWRVDPPARLASARAGVHVGGDIYDHARLVAYGCAGGGLALTLVAKGAPATVVLRSGGDVWRQLDLKAEEVWSGVVPAKLTQPPGAGECEYDVEVTNIVGSTRFELVA